VTLEDLHDARNERENTRETLSRLYGLPDMGETPDGSLLGKGKSVVY